MKPIGKEELYGLQTNSPAPEIGPKGFTLNTYTPNRSKGVKANAGGYGLLLHEVEYGKTGSMKGIVTVKPDAPGSGEGVIASNLCKDRGTRPIGKIIQSDEDALRISVDADLCKADSSTIQQCENGCPVVDHLSADVNIAFGWRQFGPTAPTDIRTPGIQRLHKHHAGYSAGSDEFWGQYGDSKFRRFIRNEQPVVQEVAPAAGSAGAAPYSCACSCEELADIDRRAGRSEEIWRQRCHGVGQAGDGLYGAVPT